MKKDKILYLLLHVLLLFSLLALVRFGSWSFMLMTAPPEQIAFAVHPVPWYQDISLYILIIVAAYIAVSYSLIRKYRAIITKTAKEQCVKPHEGQE